MYRYVNTIKDKESMCIYIYIYKLLNTHTHTHTHTLPEEETNCKRHKNRDHVQPYGSIYQLGINLTEKQLHQSVLYI